MGRMAGAGDRGLRRLARMVDAALARIEVLVILPTVAALAVWLGLDHVVTALAFALPALLALRSLVAPPLGDNTARTGHLAIPGHPGALTGWAALSAMLERVARIEDHDSACILIQIDDWDRIVERWGAETAEHIAQRSAERLLGALRHDDMVARLGEARFGVVLHPVQAARLGIRVALCDRLRAALAEPIAIGGVALRLNASSGHAGLRHDGQGQAEATLVAAEAALMDAVRNGPNAVRAFAPALLRARSDRSTLTTEVEAALDASEISAWFQPQVATESGVISGFEALARWHHPERGVLLPASFLPAVEDAGCMDRFGQHMIIQALAALRSWDQEGVRVPSVSVNFSVGELRNPRLADLVKWEIDRFDMRPGRLNLDIVEAVAANSTDATIAANIAALRAHGITLDLDDFGVGQASLGVIRRLGVTRIKIDGFFIRDLDRDPEQQAMVTAILSMARHLGVETLAKSVETTEVRALLARMGCDHVQGFHIAEAMPLDQTIAWATQHNEGLSRRATLGRRAG